MARKVELGAGIAAGILSILALVVILFAPIVSYCTVHAPLNRCPSGDLRSASLLHIGLDFGAWSYLVGMAVVIVTAAAVAIAEVRYGRHGGAVLLWVGALIAFGGCTLTASGIGIFYLPSVLAVCLAAYASILPRFIARRRASAATLPRTPSHPDHEHA